MKKNIIRLILIIVVSLMTITPVHASVTYAKHSSGAILIEASSGQILYSKNETKRLYPASTTKIMTMILLFEAIEKKQLKWTDVLTTSEYASSMGGSQVYLEPGEKITVNDLFKSIAIASANDSCVVVGEGISGNYESFVQAMNDKAKDLKLKNTHFMNCTGLHDAKHYTCALDLATMAKYLIHIGGKQLLRITSLYDSYIRQESKKKFWLVNTNKLLKKYDGVDGLKTGYTKQAGYCLVTTCYKNGMRLIGVLMNEEDPNVRNEEMMALLNFGYSTYSIKKIYKKNDVIDTYVLNTFETNKFQVEVKDDVCFIQRKDEQGPIKKKIVYHKISLPLHKQKKIGYLRVYNNHGLSMTYPLYSKQSIKSYHFIEKTYYILRDLL